MTGERPGARTVAVAMAALASGVFLGCASGTAPSRVDSPPGPYRPVTRLLANPSFEDGRQPGGRPVKWGGGNAALMVDVSSAHDGHSSARIHRTSQTGGDFGTITSCFPATTVAGGAVRYRGFLKSVDAKSGGLWMRVDGPKSSKRPLAFDNMRDRAVRGTTGWKRYSVELPVPANAKNICLGVLLAGEGTLWADGLTLEVARVRA
jgi:hypothetical protein